MKSITLTISAIDQLNSIQKKLSERKPLTKSQHDVLSIFLAQLPPTDALLIEKTPLDEQFGAQVWDIQKIDDHLEQWKKLFGNLPGWDYCPFSYVVDGSNLDMLHKKVIIIAVFSPSYTYNFVRSSEQRGYEVWLKDDGMALFWLPTLADAEKYPELYNFKGTWKEAYYLLIETLKKGWPMEEFPEELLPFLKK